MIAWHNILTVMGWRASPARVTWLLLEAVGKSHLQRCAIRIKAYRAAGSHSCRRLLLPQVQLSNFCKPPAPSHQQAASMMPGHAPLACQQCGCASGLHPACASLPPARPRPTPPPATAPPPAAPLARSAPRHPLASRSRQTSRAGCRKRDTCPPEHLRPRPGGCWSRAPPLGRAPHPCGGAGGWAHTHRVLRMSYQPAALRLPVFIRGCAMRRSSRLAASTCNATATAHLMATWPT